MKSPIDERIDARRQWLARLKIDYEAIVNNLKNVDADEYQFAYEQLVRVTEEIEYLDELIKVRER